MNNGLLLVPLGLLASLTFLLDRLYAPVTELDEEVFLNDGYGFFGVAAFVVGVSVLTLIVLALFG